MNIPYAVLPGCPGAGRCDAMNLKSDPDEAAKLCAAGDVYPAYHMNHRQWITVTLDDRLSDERVMGLIGESFRLTGKR